MNRLCASHSGLTSERSIIIISVVASFSSSSFPPVGSSPLQIQVFFLSSLPASPLLSLQLCTSEQSNFPALLRTHVMFSQIR